MYWEELGCPEGEHVMSVGHCKEVNLKVNAEGNPLTVCDYGL
jgi:hypothetical protein